MIQLNCRSIVIKSEKVHILPNTKLFNSRSGKANVKNSQNLKRVKLISLYIAYRIISGDLIIGKLQKKINTIFNLYINGNTRQEYHTQ